MANAMANVLSPETSTVLDVAKNKREKGTGTIYQRAADGMWCASLELPSPDGTKRRRKVLVRAKKADVVEALRAARRELERSGDLPTASPSLSTWLDLWFDRIATPRLKVSTRPAYRSKIDLYIKPSIGQVRLDKLTPAHVQRMHAFITTDKGLSPTTALQAHRILAKALTDAVREGRINRNVATLVDAPRKAATKIPALDAAQAKTLLLSAAEDPDQAAAWSVALLTGMRQGERLGITREQVDLDAGTITVAWQLKRLDFDHGCGPRAGDTWPCGRKRGGNCPDRTVNIPADQEARHLDGGLWLLRPKSRAGWREVPMAPPLHAILTRYLAGRALAPGDLVFTRPDGRPIQPRNDSGAWDAALRAAGLPDVTEHSARHTCATLLFELGVPEQTRIKILGHSSATVTAGYTKVADVAAFEAMSQLGQLLAGD